MVSRDEPGEVTRYHFNGYSLDLCKRCLFDREGKLVPLSSRALDTLQLLIEHRGATLSKTFLVENVWPDAFVDENNLNQAITGIRRALGDTKAKGRFIKTVTGRGYCFVAELDQPHAAAASEARPETAHDAAANPSPELPLPTQAKQLERRRFASPWYYALVVLLFITGSAGFVFNSRRMETAPVDVDTQAASPASGAPALQKIANSLAVLPLNILNPVTDRNSEFFAVGLHDEIINQFSRLPNLNVVSRRSVIAPRVQELSLREIGELLKVGAIVTGTVLFGDGTARIKLQMLNPETRMIMWTFEHDVDVAASSELLQTQRELAMSAIESLRAERRMDESLPQLDWPTQSFAAYRYNMAAQRAFNTRDMPKSLELSQRALAVDPNYLDALYNFSRVNFFLAPRPMHGMTTRAHVKQGLESAERLIELAPQNPRGYVLKAVALAHRGEWDDAMSEVQRLQLGGTELRDLQLLAPLLMTLGQHDTTIAILEANLQTDPLNSNDRGFLMAAYEAVGNSVQARLEYATGDELVPDWWGDTVDIFLSLGRGEPVANLENIKSSEIRSLLEEFNAGKRAEVLAELHARADDDIARSSALVHYAALAAALGDDTLAIEFMRRAIAVVPTHLHWMWLPVFRSSWSNPHMSSLLEESGVLAYWERHGPPEICRSAADYAVCGDKRLYR
ncbi:MAG: winged helix-turn-helix domain-containing protein [Gammaproteobacteria bacterium]